MRTIHQESKAPVILAFLLPSLLGFVLFILLPSISTLVMSTMRYSGGRTMTFIGLRNFARAFSSTAFWRVAGVTTRFVVVSVVLQLALGLFYALLLDRAFRTRVIFRTIFFLPTILSSIAVSLAFALIFHPSRGPMNQFLIAAGIGAQPWLTSPDTALNTIIFVVVWQTFGYYMIIYLAGLQTINDALYESADIDGASTIAKLRHITIPLLTPTTFLCVTLAIIRGFQVFDQVFIMTGGQVGGGPAGSTTVMVFEIYRSAFVSYDMGYAAAEATIMLAVVLAVTLVQYRFQSRWVNYDAV